MLSKRTELAANVDCPKTTQVAPPSMLFSTPWPGRQSWHPLPSPVPAYTVSGVLSQSTAMAPIAIVTPANDGWLSVMVVQCAPLSCVFQTPPSAVPRQMLSPLALAASAVTRPLVGPKVPRLVIG